MTDSVATGLVAGFVILWGLWGLALWTGTRANKPEPPPDRDTDGADWIEGDKYEAK